MIGGYAFGSAAIASVPDYGENEYLPSKKKNSRQTMNVMPGVMFQVIEGNM